MSDLLKLLHDVDLSGLADADLLQFDLASKTWKADGTLAALTSDIKLYNGSTLTAYSTIAAAMAAAVAGDTVLLGPGTYAESITIPAGVSLQGYPERNATIIQGSGATGTRVALQGNESALRYVTVELPTDGVGAITVDADFGEAQLIWGVHLRGQGGNGLGVWKNAGTGSAFAVDVNYIDGTSGTTFRCDAGKLSMSRCSFVSGTVSNILHVAGGTLTVHGFHVDSASAGVGIYLEGGVSSLYNVDFGEQPTAAVFSDADGWELHAHNCNFHGLTYDWELAGVTGVGTILETSFCDFRVEKLTFPQAFADNAAILASFVDDGVNNDSAFRVVGEFSVGMPELPKESVFGEGDSSSFGQKVFTFATVGSVYTDVTDEASSKTGSTFTVFPDVAAGNACYFGHLTRKFSGIKFDMTSAITLGAGTIVWEYWSGAAWTAFNVLFTEADAPYSNLAQAGFTNVNNQCRWDDTALTGWATTAVDGTTCYWVRARITVGINTSPVVERTKLHTNRTEINKDGFVEFFGTAEPRRALAWHRRLEDDLSGSSPGNANIVVSAGITLAAVNNSFANSAVDGNGGTIVMPEGIDTSRPLEFEILWIPAANGAPSDVELEMNVVQVSVGDTLDGTLAQTSPTPVITTVGAADQDVLKKSTFSIDVPDLLPGELLVLSYFRDATVGNADDTLAAAIEIVATSLFGYFWH